MAEATHCTTSFWAATAAPVPMPRLSLQQQDARVDVCIVGAGIAGLSAAYQLLLAGKSVMVLDDGAVGTGVSARSTGHLTAMLDDRYFELERLHGAQGAQLAAESHRAAIDEIERIVAQEHIDCDFERIDGYLFLGHGEQIETLEREYAATLRAGLSGVEFVPRAPLPFDTQRCLRYPRQGQFHVVKYMNGLAQAIVRRGGQIFTAAHVAEIEDGTPATVATVDGVEINADAVIVATNVPINNRVTIHTKQAAYRSYVIGVAIPRGSVRGLLAWSTGDPYHYVRTARLDATHDLLIVGGEDFKTGQDEDTEYRFDLLEQWTRSRFPLARTVEYRWSGQIMEPMDGLGFIGRNPGDRNIYIVTGDSGNGLTHATLGSVLLRDLILGAENPWARLYDPERVNLRAGKTFMQENLNVARQYSDWAKGGEVDSVEDIGRGMGAVLRRGLHKLAVYRDETGRLHEMSATCPHLGCVVNWNDAEKTWDCPCHGSRFDCMGKVVNGPAVQGLAPLATAQRTSR